MEETNLMSRKHDYDRHFATELARARLRSEQDLAVERAQVVDTRAELDRELARTRQVVVQPVTRPETNIYRLLLDLFRGKSEVTISRVEFERAAER